MPMPPSTTTRRCRFGQQQPPSPLPDQDANAALIHQPPRRFGQQPPPSALPDEDADAAILDRKFRSSQLGWGKHGGFRRQRVATRGS
jgi:hypothetical protein